jgi:ABC-type sugar transport system substrate-binding protein
MSQFRSIPSLVVLTGVLALVAAGCGSSSSGSTKASSITGGSSSSSGGVIGFSIPQGSNTALQALAAGLRSEAAKGGLQVDMADANLDPSKQISDVETFVQQKVKAIVIWPLDDHAIQPAFAQARAAHIPIITIYTLFGGPYYTDIILDGTNVGRDAALWFAAHLPKDAKVAAILGPPPVDQFRDIAAGFKAGAQEAHLNVVSSQIDPALSPQDAVSMTQDLKTRFGSSLKGLFDTLESQAIASATVTGGGFHPQIVTYGGTNDSINGLKTGKLAVSFYQNPTLTGRIAGWAAREAVAGKTIPTKIYLEVPEITPALAATFPTDAQQLTQPYSFTPVQQNGRWTLPMFK